ncbi:hypothetical protein QBC34DRAFT_177059 [Podospora aff. communis PSN243]|uniref:Uncharacterized protein n=1 Tax=Podospora aff. communis PSN243 TaxID=3040156 RepID=A0AAV9H227_9PEZI|nr:hypothetical protein QBC34DRAFT_177059 [Podospora aff. communis PSN243]
MPVRLVTCPSPASSLFSFLLPRFLLFPSLGTVGALRVVVRCIIITTVIAGLQVTLVDAPRLGALFADRAGPYKSVQEPSSSTSYSDDVKYPTNGVFRFQIQACWASRLASAKGGAWSIQPVRQYIHGLF